MLRVPWVVSACSPWPRTRRRRDSRREAMRPEERETRCGGSLHRRRITRVASFKEAERLHQKSRDLSRLATPMASRRVKEATFRRVGAGEDPVPQGGGTRFPYGPLKARAEVSRQAPQGAILAKRARGSPRSRAAADPRPGSDAARGRQPGLEPRVLAVEEAPGRRVLRDVVVGADGAEVLGDPPAHRRGRRCPRARRASAPRRRRRGAAASARATARPPWRRDPRRCPRRGRAAPGASRASGRGRASGGRSSGRAGASSGPRTARGRRAARTPKTAASGPSRASATGTTSA